MAPSDDTIMTSRPLANYHPSLWGDLFLLQSEPAVACTEQSSMIEALKEELKRELNEASKNSLQQLQLIDAIQRLGVEYHFEKEIEQALQNIFETYDDYCKDNSDLCHVALCFRLMRQHGHNVSCEAFEKFKDVNGEFTASMISDVMGMLELYEAAHLSVRGDDILDDALSFMRTHLQSILSDLSGPIFEQVFHALQNYSNRRGLTRVEARLYMDIYQKTPSHHESLLKFAKLDFNMLQSLHKRELSEVYRWWKGLDVETNLPYTRDRMVEIFFWVTGVYFEPQYSLARNISARLQATMSIIDDTYDAYGTFEELTIFTEAIERWSIGCLDQLPEYMKLIYKTLLELVEEIEEELTRLGRSYRVAYGKQVAKELVSVYYEEAKWREKKYVPTMEEYMSIAMTSCGYMFMITVSFLGVGDAATKEAFDWVQTQPDIVKAALIICRLIDDIVGNEFEQERDHVASAIECYMKQYNVSRQEVVDEFNSRIEAAWKDVNQGFFRPMKFHVSLLHRILNLSRVMEVMYKKGDWYIHVGPEMQSFIKMIFIDPID